jgi:hypothetical protein
MAQMAAEYTSHGELCLFFMAAKVGNKRMKENLKHEIFII